MPYFDYLFLSDISTILVFGGLLGCSITLVECGLSGLLTAIILVGVVVCQIWNLTDVKPLTWLSENPAKFAECLAAYALAGVVWGYVKWWFYLSAIKRDYLARGYSVFSIRDFPPKVSDNKYLIITWMMYWPPSLVWTLVHDPVYRFFNTLFHWVSGSFQRISDRMFKDIVAAKKDD